MSQSTLSCENEDAHSRAAKRPRIDEEEEADDSFCENSTSCSFFSSNSEATRPAAEEESEEVSPDWIKTPMIHQRFLLKHPRVILAFLTFVDLYNELAEGEEILLLPAIPQRVVNTIFDHPAVKSPPEEFQEQVRELKARIEAHMDLSELQWQ